MKFYRTLFEVDTTVLKWSYDNKNVFYAILNKYSVLSQFFYCLFSTYTLFYLNCVTEECTSIQIICVNL